MSNIQIHFTIYTKIQQLAYNYCNKINSVAIKKLQRYISDIIFNTDKDTWKKIHYLIQKAELEANVHKHFQFLFYQ